MQEERDAISKLTKVAMNESQRAGEKFGSPNIDHVQRNGRDAWSEKSEDIARCIAAVLRSLPDWKAMKRREIADELNRRGLLTGHDLPWETSRIRVPLKRAEEMLAKEEESTMSKLPTFGLL